MSDDYLWDKSGPPDPVIADLERSLGQLRHRGRPVALGEGQATRAEKIEEQAGGKEEEAKDTSAPAPLPAPIPITRARRAGWTARVLLAAAAALALGAGGVWFATREASGPAVAGPGPASSGAIEAPIVQASVVPDPQPRPQPQPPREGPAFEVTRVAGAPRIDATAMDGKGQLAVGAWLETDATSRAKIAIASIGQVEVAPGSRVQLVATSETEHRIDLAHGGIKAKILAPPRLFIVGTPAATAVDLGCAYSLDVDAKGVGALEVTSGWVSLEAGERTSLVPAGARCQTRPGVGPGTPYFADASESLVRALASFDFSDGGETSVRTILKEARRRDSLTLWHLLSRVDTEVRREVFQRLRTLAPPPAGVREPDIVRLDPAKMDRYKDSLLVTW